MYCLRCGKDTQDENVFCQACIGTMEQHPIKPGTPVQLLHRPEPVRRSKGRQGPSLEEQLHSLKKLIFIMGLLLVVVTAALGAALFVLFNGTGF